MGNNGAEQLLVRTNGQTEDRVDLAGPSLTIGRGPRNQVVLADSFASSQHAELVSQGGKRCLRDLGSRNGTRLNGQPVEPRRLYPVHDGDVIEIGTTELTFRLGVQTTRPSASAAPAHRPRVLPVVGRLIARMAVLVIAVAVVVVGAAWLLSPSRVGLLVMGSDARPDELRRGAVGRTDSMLAVVAGRSPSGAVLISIPRDLWVTIPGYGEERINVAYAVRGPDVAERTVGDVLGVPVERHLVIGLQGVRDVVDAAGGIEIDVERPIHDPAYPTDDYGTVVVDIPAGRQHMDGETALRYARTRHQDSDFGRIARQQQVMLALRTQLLKPINWWRIPAVLGAVREATRTDLGLLDLATLAFAFGAGGSEPERLAVDHTLIEELRGRDGAYLLLPRPALRQRVAALLSPSSAAIEVLNGSRTDGLARETADRLRGREMRVVNVGNTPRPQPDTTVEVRPGLTRAGAYAASALDLPSAAVRESASLPDGVDVRITLGEDRG